jgi:hypothetical protein
MRKAFIWGLLLGLVMSFGGFKFWNYARTPATSRSKEADFRQVLGGRAPRNPTDAPQGEIEYRGQYMTFEYPARAREYLLKKSDDSILEQIDLEIDSPRLTIVATVIATGEKTLDEVSGVRMRRDQTDVYREDAGVFTKLDGKEKTVFMMYHDRLYTLSITGNDAGELAKLWSQVLPTWHFL